MNLVVKRMQVLGHDIEGLDNGKGVPSDLNIWYMDVSHDLRGFGVR